ncbi:unnamed protein product [Darwinula stevensoni]|uniref:RING-type E3 ubiquitin transferase n=1 Tax=Darwinula stevensoni TaxID=69355 RepID=A0A7R9AFR9_9CRUS|nr:unnamed protein product [Darwinula stevensoni]CAG0903575.1 unnamed protein product [Darwinula stevensoni]
MEAGRCKACRCDAAKHFNSPHRFQTSKERRTLKDLKHSHRAKTRRNESLLEILKRKYERGRNEMMNLVLEAHEKLCKLEPMSISEYMEILISSENKQTRLGWVDRIRILQEIQDLMGMGHAENEIVNVIESGIEKQVKEQEPFASRAAMDDDLIKGRNLTKVYFLPQNSALECKICEEGFRAEGDRVPRLLPCGHTLCHSCLGMLARGGTSVLCPFDRSAATMGPDGVNGLKKNFALLELIPTGNLGS